MDIAPKELIVKEWLDQQQQEEQESHREQLQLHIYEQEYQEVPKCRE